MSSLPEMRGYMFHNGGNSRLVCHVHRMHLALAACGGNFIDGTLPCFFIQLQYVNGGATGGKTPRNGLADTASGAGYHSHFSI